MMSDDSDSNEHGALLRSPEVRRDPKRYLKEVQNVIASMTSGVDVSNVFSEMIMAGATTDLVQKKLVYLYLSNYAKSNSELALLTVNTMQKDCQDRDPLVRGLALKTMCSLRLPNMVQYLCEPLQTGLKDNYAYVRRIAVMGVAKLYYVAPDTVTKLNFVDILYQMLRDRDPQVVSNCISALNEILANEGGMVVNSKITHYLLNRLRDFSEWSQCQILDLLHRYQPSSEDEVFDIMSILDDRLKHSNIGVAMGTIRLFIQFTKSMPEMQPKVFERIRTPLLTFLGSSSTELVYTCLQHIQLLLARQPDMWSKDYQNFFCRYKDPPYLKIKKLELLTEVCTIGNAQSIVDELGECATDVNVFVARRAVEAIGQIALVANTNSCVNKLLFLLKMNVSYITTETLVALTSILRKFENMVEVIIPQLPTSFDSITDPEGRSALIWILGEYGESLPNTPYVLEEVVQNISEESSSAVKLQLLSAVMKMFFKRPPECQEMLGRLLEKCIDYREGNMDVHCRAMLYYRLLQHNIKEAQRIVCGQVEKAVVSQSKLPQKLSLFPEFNTLSVMYGKLSSDFITQECPYVLGHVAPSSTPESSCFEDRDSCTVQDGSDTPGDFNSFWIQSFLKADEDSKFPAILLNPKPVLTAGEFEKMWLSTMNTEELQVHLSHVPSAGELKKTLASRFIMTMATSPSYQPVIKMFFYAQHVSTFHYFLMEVTIAIANAMLSFILKCENPKLAPSFLKHFLKTLGLSDQPKPPLQWNMCADIPSCMKNAQGVIYNGQLHVGGGYTNSPKADAIIYAYNSEADMWKLLPSSPLKWFAMAVLNEQLVLVGGKEVGIKMAEYTNKLACWEKEKHAWSLSLPPMQAARISPIAFSHNHFLVVAGGKRGSLDYSVEILNSQAMQWYHVSPLPLPCLPHTSTLCSGSWCLLRESDGTVLRADVHSFIKDVLPSNGCEEIETGLGSRETTKSRSVWKSVPKPGAIPLRIASIGKNLVAICPGTNSGKHLVVYTYFPEAGQWCHTGHLPQLCANASCVTTPHGDLFLVGGDGRKSGYSNKVFRASLTVDT